MKNKNYWLLKTEPSSYSIDDFKKDKKTIWSGVRNYQARNFIKAMKKGDLFLFYHSGSNPAPAVVGIGKVSRDPFPDPTQFEKKDSHFDPKATKEKPIWYCTEVSFVKKLKIPVTLNIIKKNPILKTMPVVQKGSRLSVLPALQKHFEYFEKNK
jgi:predicted RNA-binding protein with PUA-like domain